MQIDGKAIAASVSKEIGEKVAKLSDRPPGLAVILVGQNPASQIYVKRKTQEAQACGIRSEVIRCPAEVSQAELLAQIDRLNADPATDGILLQLPLPRHLNPQELMWRLDPNKDVDGFHPINVGKLLAGDTSGFVPCTPLGIVELLRQSRVQVAGRHVVIIGRSNIVGKPLASLLLQKRPGCNATVTVAHSATENLVDHCRRADILVAAIGSPHFINASMVREGAVVIDVGINRIDDPSRRRGYRLVGDVAFDEVAPKASLITPVPGGVGPMTVAMLLHNTWSSFSHRHE